VAPAVLLAAALGGAGAMAAGCRAGDRGRGGRAMADHLGPAFWTAARWQRRCGGVRTSYNPDRELTDDTLTLVPGDARWLDFVYWAFNNKVTEHQVEAYGGTGWDGPKGGVIFHWAPGSHWERDTLASFGFTLGHTAGEHRLVDTMFPAFFERYGGTYGVSLKDRLTEIAPTSPQPWIDFLEYTGGAESPYYRYLFHQEAVVDAAERRIHFIAGQGVAFSYTFERYYHELREVLTDCRAVDFFEMYDLLGPGFAARGNWARQDPPEESLARVGYVGIGAPVEPGRAQAQRYQPIVAPIPVPPDLAEAARMRRGQTVYLAQCSMCHGVAGDGAGFLAAGFDVAPRDFRAGTYKYRSTEGGELPTVEDLERVIGAGVPGTTMPAWAQFLTPDQIGDVARYLVVLSPRHLTAWRAGQVPRRLASTTPPRDLPIGSPAAVTAGAALWRQLQCAQCHGADGKGGGPSAATLVDDWGRRIKATDLTYRWSFRNRHAPGDIYRTIFGGLNGTPMPAYGPALPDERDRWRLVGYVESLSPPARPVTRLAAFKAARAAATAPAAPAEIPRPGRPAGDPDATLVRIGGDTNACSCTHRIEPKGDARQGR
jgi:mono/diheme cytochrome c family protein